MRNGQGPIRNILGFGVGLATEAIQYRREREAASQRSVEVDGMPSEPEMPSTNPVLQQPPSSDPPVYAEVADIVAAPEDEKFAMKDVGNHLLDDEADWELDEAARNYGPPSPPSYNNSESAESAKHSQPQAKLESDKVAKREALVRELVELVGPVRELPQKLPCPVIIPQRRPGKRERGFVRAYAPVLNDCGVSQDVFLKFLKDFNTASRVNPLLDIVIVSAGIASFAPALTAMIVTTAVQLAAVGAKEVQSRHRRNTYLDRINQDIFMPRGLFAMIMAFKPESEIGQGTQRGLVGGLLGSIISSERLDMEQAALKYSQQDPTTSRMQQYKRNFRVESGVTRGELEMPEAAELIYPDIDHVVARTESLGSTEKAKQKLKSANKFVQSYLDRRAQAKYATDNPNSTLAGPPPKFASKWSDPNYFVNEGGLPGLGNGREGQTGSRALSGGLLGSAVRMIQDVHEQRSSSNVVSQQPSNRSLIGSAVRMIQDVHEQRSSSNIVSQQTSNPPAPYGDGSYNHHRGLDSYGRQHDDRAFDAQMKPNRPAPQGKVRGRGIRKLMQQDVLYLIVVNLPTQEEMKHNVTALERAVKGRRAK